MFDTINYILFEPRKNLDARLVSEFSPYMVTRYLSFYGNGAYVDYINMTFNKYQNLFPEAEDQFRLFDALSPKPKRRKIAYVKKPKRKEEETRVIPDFYSKREIDYFSSMMANI